MYFKVQPLVLVLFLFFSVFGNSQTCQINPNASYPLGWGGHPSPSDGLDTAILGEPYNQVIQFRPPETAEDVAPDNCSPFCAWNIIEVELVSIDGLETTGMNQFDVSCNPPSCSWQGGSDGCIIINGTPSAAGHHNLWIKMNGTADGGIFGNQSENFTIHDYFIFVDNPAVGLNTSVDKQDFVMTQTGYATVFSLSDELVHQNPFLEITSIEGKRLHALHLRSSTHSIDLNNGVYFVTLILENNERINKKIIVNQH